MRSGKPGVRRVQQLHRVGGGTGLFLHLEPAVLKPAQPQSITAALGSLRGWVLRHLLVFAHPPQGGRKLVCHLHPLVHSILPCGEREAFNVITLDILLWETIQMVQKARWDSGDSSQ